ncbi:NPCBM/NEW2 domain-containing protein [Novosphingobium pokkalii]|uniref:NPCBM/NEW2 domain-containing protein n=1 Tax=Novosphingobium pokkalii TaxID=1770194 RepID=UPI00362C055B
MLSLCLWGSANVRSWGKDLGNMSRTSEDISPTWARMLHNLDSTARRPLYAHPGSWNDPDMLFIGKGEFDATHAVEARSHFALWAMENAPLLIGMDLRQANAEQMALLGWKAAIALNQDPAGNQAVLAYDSAEVQIYVKTLADGTKAVALLNRSAAATHATLTAAHLKLVGEIATTDLWTGKSGRFTDETTVPLAPHETVLLKVSGRRRLPDGLYLSEMPGRVNPAVDGVVQPQPDPLVHRGLLPWNDTRGTGEHPRYGGWGGAAVDSGPYGQELQAGHEKIDTGIGILAGSRLQVRNAGQARFTARVGVDDAAWGNSGAVTFQVYGDGRLLAQSAPLRAGAALVPLAADVRGVRLIELVTRPARASDAPIR